MTTNTFKDLYSVWGSASDDVYVVGEEGLLLHFDGSIWAETIIDTLRPTVVWGSAADEVYLSHDPGPS